MIELLVVSGVLTLLIAILLPAISQAREASRRAVCLANLKQVGVGVFSYAVANRDWGPAVMDKMGTRAPRTLLSRPGRKVNLGLLLSDEIDDARVFFCPSQEQFNYNSRIEQIGQGVIGGSYAYAVNLPASESPRLGVIRHLSLASDDFTGRLGAGGGIGSYAHKVGYNVLYTDGSALWYADREQRIAKRSILWDDETDDFNYSTFYQPGQPPPDPSSYGDEADIFRVWHAFCYNLPAPTFTSPEDTGNGNGNDNGDDD